MDYGDSRAINQLTNQHCAQVAVETQRSHRSMHAGLTAYEVEQEFGAWHVWVPASLLGDSGCTADGLHVQITASELSAGSGGGTPYLEVHMNRLPGFYSTRSLQSVRA